ncbi:MAG: 6-carboxytetrahydropterin synthase QueD [Thermoanaerobacteraceae bacterium]|uniref:6-carboxy-5,6,7,8-tetrahydropterin synthase n=1 Tax=Desulfofundulus thermobenzoicus TaxID=29376 RepID=A0A6N7ITJ2_9FIRM|nr:6-carboxytetrahydropterin synthase QueD [Desulfofundulus thermobenzoicus]MBE3589035.1 6-carboxytetrahydropterin synthase QueD [Thermoanaerobacteraceae bacterium]MQL53370.1 6-carboxytetrahydropterin synthase QueD [Desulfofundulus thermobenzoicus]HHW43685.1 6-carboxytetrahydropterin synthase QueD [Desulfotomaculum sp.]
MYRLTVIKRFAAAHRLINYRGQCSRLHGHTWTVEVSVQGEQLDANGMLVDFRDLKEMVARLIGELDHSYLNELPPFNTPDHNPTAENLASYLFRQLKARLHPALTLNEVRVWESPDACASYREE